MNFLESATGMQDRRILSSQTEGTLNNGMNRLIAMVSLVLLVLLSSYAGLAYGQAETGNINGTVTDSTGAVIPNAKVVVKNVNTGAERPTVTDGNGYYHVSNLLPGTYAVAVDAPGLAKKEIRAEVTVGGRLEVNVTLIVGATSTVVEVVGAGGVQVNTETATIGTVIDSQSIQQLPTVNRDPYAFASYVGNASDASPTGPAGYTGSGVGVSFNGLRAASTNILLDGASNNDEFVGSVGQTIPLDSVQEYSVLTNNFTAEFGRASGGIVNVATKSGTNTMHGSAYEYNRVSKLSANSFFNNANELEKGAFTRNQFGGSVGGPIKKDKLFFFGNAEWNRIRSSANSVDYVIAPEFLGYTAAPTQDFFNQLGTFRSGATPVPGQTVPFSQSKYCGSATSAAAVNTTAYNVAHELNTCTDVPDGTPFLDQYTYRVPADAGAGSPENQALVVGRVDWNISDKTQLYGRYALDNEGFFPGTVNNSVYAGYDTVQNNRQNNFLLSLTHTFNPQWTLQNKVVFNRLSLVQPLGSAPVTPTLYFNPSVPTTVNGFYLMMPGYNATTPGASIPFGGPQNYIQYYQDWSHAMGRHTLRFGGSFNYMQDNRTFGAYEEPIGSFNTSGSFGKAAMNRFLGGYLGYYNGAVDPQGNYPCPYAITPGQACGVPQGTPDSAGDVTLPVSQPSFSRSNRYHEFALYLTDSWKMTSRLTWDLGLRYEYFGTQHNNNQKLDSNYYLGSGATIQEQIRNGSVQVAPESPVGELWGHSYKNFAPRIGFAYDLFGNGKTVVRGGYSIAYERNFGNVTFNVIQNPPAQAIVALTDNGNYPLGGMTVTTDWAGPLAGSSGAQAIPNVSLRAVDPHIHQSYAETFSLTVEHEIKHNILVGLDYSGSHGEHLYDLENINRYGSGAYYLGDADPLARLRTTQYSNINWRGSNGMSRYNAMIARIQMNNFGKTGLTLNANYTFAHTMDELSDTFSSSGNNFDLGYLDPFNPRQDYGNSMMDIRHRFTASAVWEVPFAKSTHGFVKQIADGWTVAPLLIIETGSPFSIFDCTNGYTVCPYAMNANGGLKRGAPSKLTPTADVPDNFMYTNFYAADGTTPLFDSSYFDPITGLSDYGPWPATMNARSAFRGPGYWNMDLGVYKSFFLTERFKLQFRGEMYNVFNHANLYVNNGDVDTSYNSFVDAYKDGHRTVQLALRLVF
jgi:outer membrane receptor protein involved in Fe transport